MGGERFEITQPEAYLFGENQDLNFLGSRPVPVSCTLCVRVCVCVLVCVHACVHACMHTCVRACMFVSIIVPMTYVL